MTKQNRVLLFCVGVLVSIPALSARAAELKINLCAADLRKDILMPHWENWHWKDGKSGAEQFGEVGVKLEAASGGTVKAVLVKALLEKGVHMSLTGLTTAENDPTGELVMTISGLSPGRHTLATYHNEIREFTPPHYEVLVDDKVVEKDLTPTKRIENDYDAACAYFNVDAAAGKDVVVRIRPVEGSSVKSCIINGLEIDAVDPHLKAIKPSPANDDEHVAQGEQLKWAPAQGAITSRLYFGSDEKAVANATPESPEFKGRIKEASFKLPNLELMDTYYWRIDEEYPNGQLVKGEMWRLRPRTLAFPTAEGYGRFARGGRGGKVLEVTNLDDYDANEAPIPGSYRWAVSAEGPRTVVFRVSGLIKLKRPCAITNPYITIAGQTAPGEGICLANYSSGLSTHDAIVRNIRLRVGDISHKAMDGMGMGAGTDDSIIDHCSISWAMDEGTSSRTGKNITFQWNIISEMLCHAYHYNARERGKTEPHAFAGSISGKIGSFHHNLLAHCTDRNWSLAGGYDQAGQYAGYLDIRNNVVYNWVGRTTDGGVMQLNYVNNYYKPYPQQPKYALYLLKLDPVLREHGTPKYYMTGNVMEGKDYDDDNWKAFQNGPELAAIVRVNEPLFPSYVTTQSARDCFEPVLNGAGCIYPQRDVIDKRIVEETRTGTVHYTGTKGPTSDPPGKDYPGIIDTQTDVKDAVDSPNFPWPAYKSAATPKDSDHDGMPDDWEIKHGLNPNDPSDGNGDPGKTGYTNLERYLGYLVGEFDESGKVIK